MTNKEALEALLDGKKIRKPLWGEGRYLCFDSDTDSLRNEDNSYCYFNFSRPNWEIYEEPLLTEGEKQFVSKIADAMRSDKTGISVKVNDYGILIENPNFSFYYDFGQLIYDFCGLERNREYSLEELGINGDD
jgi:hypothetical protein